MQFEPNEIPDIEDICYNHSINKNIRKKRGVKKNKPFHTKDTVVTASRQDQYNKGVLQNKQFFERTQKCIQKSMPLLIYVSHIIHLSQ